LYGGSLGLDWRVHTTGARWFGSHDIIVTTGVRRLYTTRMERPGYLADAESQLVSRSERERLGIWVPFLAVALAIDTRPSARAAIVPP
jgi:hypothetical protein